jgi:hypothetical protein
MSSERFESGPILSLNPLFCGIEASGLTANIMKVSRSIEAIPITSTKILSLLFVFYLFCPNSLFQPQIQFSLHPDGSLRCSRWPSDLEQPLGELLPTGPSRRSDPRRPSQVCIPPSSGRSDRQPLRSDH